MQLCSFAVACAELSLSMQLCSCEFQPFEILALFVFVLLGIALSMNKHLICKLNTNLENFFESLFIEVKESFQIKHLYIIR